MKITTLSPISIITILLALMAFTISCEKCPAPNPPIDPTTDIRYPTPFQSSEFDIASTIIVHEPGDEILPAMLHPQAALFDVYFNINKSQSEHRAYVKKLREFGAQVLYVKDILLHGCESPDGIHVQNLRQLASKIITYKYEGFSPEEESIQEQYKADIIDQLSLEELVNHIIKQPTVILSKTSHNTGYEATYQYNPLMNLFYTRDQMITTSKGVIISKMNSSQRQNECQIMKFILSKLKVQPLHEIVGDGAFLEGGDLLMYPNLAFIGCGLRTTQLAINQLLENDLFGTESVIVVKDQWKNQAEMHLDTYFNIIDTDLVAISEARVSAKPGDIKYLTADIYTKVAGKYELSSSNISFIDFLRNDLKAELITLSEEDMGNYGSNFLTVRPRHIMAVDGQSKTYRDQLRKAGVTVEWIDLENLTKGYGAAHCMTQVIERK